MALSLYHDNYRRLIRNLRRKSNEKLAISRNTDRLIAFGDPDNEDESDQDVAEFEQYDDAEDLEEEDEEE